jgi:hypothetical protein
MQTRCAGADFVSRNGSSNSRNDRSWTAESTAFRAATIGSGHFDSKTLTSISTLSALKGNSE